MAKQMFVFITVLRALSCIIITNSHYNNIYPLEIIANGGLLGDVLFFAISGFCLANISDNFAKWYKRRFMRIYCPVWIILAFYILCGAYTADSAQGWLKLVCWPTPYHFVGSIILLYIPFYFICRFKLNTRKYLAVSLLLFGAQLLIYLTVYDSSYYHIDTVHEPMIWFLFLQSMLLGAYFRTKKLRRGELQTPMIVALVCFMMLYFASKVVFVKCPQFAHYQLANQIILWIVLYLFFRVFMSYEEVFGRMPTKVYAVVKFLSDRTLEIYIVQYVIIGCLAYGPFPVNWLIVTFAIIVSATILRYVSQSILIRIQRDA